MLTYTIKRVLLFIPTIVAVLFITFTLGYLGPGDPIQTQILRVNPRLADQETIERLREVYGLNRPFLVQWGDWVGKIMRGDFGKSFATRTDIGPTIAYRLPISAQLGAAAFVILAIGGIFLGTLAALKQNTWIDHFIVGSALFINSFPIFVLAPLSMIVVVLWLKLLPSTLGWDGIFSAKAILPILLFSVTGWIYPIRYARNGLIEALSQDYVRTARAKGLPERLVILRHVVKNGLISTVTSLGLTVSGIVTGSLFLEAAFAIPGYGYMTVQGVTANDYNIIMATTLIGALLVIASNLITDLLYGVLDPRVRYE
ncbi:MAG: ABC transporter permease [Caldilineaceae bacterium]|nr:ABC transporter permease [Caldilineaceae bacterium]MCY3993142.1 ABC transporter permease [Caldilineaceae bacterium]MDE0076908.1 ABC transporter permease [Caldilineaceae bacterium]